MINDLFTFFCSVVDHYIKSENVLGQIFLFLTKFSWYEIFYSQIFLDEFFLDQDVFYPKNCLWPVEDELSLILHISRSPTHGSLFISCSKFYMKLEYKRQYKHKLDRHKIVDIQLRLSWAWHSSALLVFF